MVTLKYLATGSSLRSLAFDFFLGDTTVRNVVYETCKAIHAEMLAVYVPFPVDVRSQKSSTTGGTSQMP